MDDFATRIKKLRIGKKLSVQQVIKPVGCSRSSWYRYESGEITPSIKRLGKIAKVLDTTTGYLLGISAEYTPDYEITVYRKSGHDLIARIFEDNNGIKAIVDDEYEVVMTKEGKRND